MEDEQGGDAFSGFKTVLVREYLNVWLGSKQPLARRESRVFLGQGPIPSEDGLRVSAT